MAVTAAPAAMADSGPWQRGATAAAAAFGGGDGGGGGDTGLLSLFGKGGDGGNEGAQASWPETGTERIAAG